MASGKTDADHQVRTEVEDIGFPEKSEEVKVEIATAELNRVDFHRLSTEAITWKSRATFRLFLIVLIQGFAVCAFAMDGSVIGGIAALPAFREFFNVGTSGNGIGIIIAAMSIGNAVASLFQWLSDVIGRRGVTMLGNILIILGGVLQAAAPNNPCLIMGRLIAGAGSSLSATVGPVYISEIAPAAYRGMIMGFYGSCYCIGAIAIACGLLGASYMHGEWSWRMPLTIQLGPPIVVVVFLYLLTPESPRFLVAQGKVTQAREILAKLHTADDDVNAPLVAHELEQIQTSLELMQQKPWDFSTFWDNRAGRRRLWIIFLYSFFQQWNGTGMINTYMPGILTLIGITNPSQQLGINLGSTCLSFTCVLIGSLFVDKVRRRFLLIGCCIGFVFFLGLMLVFGGLFANDIAKHTMAIIMLTTIFCFTTFGGLFVSIVHSVYPNEVLHYRQRAKGMGLYSFFQNCFGFAMTYGGAVALQKLQWKIYAIFMGVNLASAWLSWKFFPEFRHLSLEEIDLVFEVADVSPVKMSLKLQKARLEKMREGRAAEMTT